MIRKLKAGEYRLYSRKRDPRTGKRRNLGTFATREEAEQILGISVARQQEITAQFTSLTKQRREVLCHPERLESLGLSQGEPHMALIPSPQKRSNHEAIVNISKDCKNQCGPQLASLEEPFLMEKVAPPDIREAALAF